MEHYILRVLFQAIVALDKVFQKSLQRIVPDIDDAFANAVAYFSYREITIPPWRRWVFATFFGLLVGLTISTIGVALVLTYLEPNPGKPLASPWLSLLVLL